MKHRESVRRARIDPACVSASVPFREVIPADALAACLRAPGGEPFWDAHLARFLGELPVAMVLGFCDRHGIGLAELRRAFRYYEERCAVRHPELQAFWMTARAAPRGRNPRRHRHPVVDRKITLYLT